MTASLGILAACESYGPPGVGGSGGDGGTAGGGTTTPSHQGGAGGQTAAGGTGGGGATGTGATGAGTTSGQGGQGGGEYKMNTSQYDCTASTLPVRVSTVPAACITDPACASILVSGHRGAGAEINKIAPEDSLASLRAAVVMGVDLVDTDPVETKDGVLVNFPDMQLEFMTEGTGNVADRTLAEIQAVKYKAEKYPGDFSCERVPTLEQVLALAKDRVHVLVDADRTDRMDLLVEAIQSTGTLDWAIVASVSADKLDEVLALEPAALTMIRVTNKADLDAKLAHFAAHPPVLVQIQDGASPIVLVPAIHDAGHRALLNVFFSDVDAALGGENDAYDKPLAWGVDILQSGRPELALEALDRWPPPPQPE